MAAVAVRDRDAREQVDAPAAVRERLEGFAGAVLALAGLLRPEAWLLGLGYLAYLLIVLC